MKLSKEMRDYPVADMIEEDADWLQKKADEVEVLEGELQTSRLAFGGALFEIGTLRAALEANDASN